jgi:hypothetical protein
LVYFGFNSRLFLLFYFVLFWRLIMSEWVTEFVNRTGRKQKILVGRNGRFGKVWEQPSGRTLWSVCQGNGSYEIAGGFAPTTEEAQEKAEKYL